jgi:hypothetical protein
MCIMNEVDPRAASLSCVLSVSSKVATRRNVTKGHQPGKARRVGQTPAPAAMAASAIVVTKSLSRVSRAIELRGGDPGPVYSLAPSRSVASTEQRSEEDRHRTDEAQSQHERHLPSRLRPSGSGKPRYGLPDAPLDSFRSVSAIVLRRPGSPFPFFPFSQKLFTRYPTTPLCPERTPRPPPPRCARGRLFRRWLCAVLSLMSIGRLGVASVVSKLSRSRHSDRAGGRAVRR